MKVEIMNQIIAKAKKRKNGIWTHRGTWYAVKNHYPKLFYENGGIYQIMGHFVTELGKCEMHKAVKEMARLLKDI